VVKRRIFSLLMVVPLLLLGFTVFNTQSAYAYTAQMIDTFDGSTLDTSKWIINNWPEGEISVNDKVVAHVSGSVESCAARLDTTWKSAVDFDARVDFEIGDGWSNPSVAHLDGAYLGVALGGDSYSNWIQITRISQPDDDHIGVDLSRPGDSKLAYIHIENNDEATSGNFRISRTGQRFDFYYDIGSGETLAYSWTAPQEVGRIKIYFGANSIGSSQAFTTYFDNFRLDYDPNTVNIDYWTSYRYLFDGDSYYNSQVTGFKNWFSQIGNVDDSTDESVYDAISSLNSNMPIGWQDASVPPTGDLSHYNWQFGDVPENISHGFSLGPVWEDPQGKVTFSQGFKAIRTATRTVFNEDGNQTVTVKVTPMEAMDQLWIRYVTSVSPLVNPTITGYSAGEGLVIDNYNDYNLWTTIDNPTIGYEYSLEITIHLDFPEAIGSVEYMPQLHITNCALGDLNVSNGPSITFNPDGLGDWTWTGDGYYSWNYYCSFFRTLHMQERINQVGPVIISPAANPNPAPINTNIILTAQASEGNAGGSNIKDVQYSLDGTNWTSMHLINNGVTVDASYVLPGFSNPTVVKVYFRATDSSDYIGPTESILLAVFDPSAGFVTGGGWINSPLGAYTFDPYLEGKANFGFVSKYKKGATVPTGETEFQFKASDLNFHSDSYQWMVVSGAKAQYKGVGTINGTGNYGFILTATDGDLKTKGTPDKFRIKIWDIVTGTIIYDNQIGADDNADPTTILGGGSIVIHK
jgi:hypothetical protein